jgi:glycosyltransferase involved in cell wall biosynthesis
MPTPSAWYRIILPFGELAAHGWETGLSASSLPPPPESGQADVFVLQGGDQREAASGLRQRRAYQRVVNETDDDFFHVPASLPRAHARYARADVRGWIAANIRACDMVTVTTEALAETIRSQAGHPDVRVIPNCVPDFTLTVTRPDYPRRTVIGWAASGSRDADFLVARNAVRHVLGTVPRTEMHFMGTDYRRLLPHGLRARHSHPPPVSTDAAAWFAGYDFDIALAPLADLPFNLARSPVKALEAFALGIPVLASDCPVYRGIVRDGINGYLCRTTADWQRRLRELACDRDARHELGAQARRDAAGHVISAGWRNWAGAYESLL